MPTKFGYSDKTRQYNIDEMIKSGMKPDRAVAAAYDIQRRARAKKRKK